jgi:hypothetical protein
VVYPQTKQEQRHKPTKPYPSFPLTPHNNGQWCKKVRGRVRSFGVWDDPDAALQNYLLQAPDLHAGREAHLLTLSADSVTVKQVVDHYLTFQRKTTAWFAVPARRRAVWRAPSRRCS